MKIELNNPIIYSISIITIIFLISVIILYLTKPSYIMEISKNGKKKKNIYLIFIYSLLFGVLFGIGVFLYKTEPNSPPGTSITFSMSNGRSFIPKNIITKY